MSTQTPKNKSDHNNDDIDSELIKMKKMVNEIEDCIHSKKTPKSNGIFKDICEYLASIYSTNSLIDFFKNNDNALKYFINKFIKKVIVFVLSQKETAEIFDKIISLCVSIWLNSLEFLTLADSFLFYQFLQPAFKKENYNDTEYESEEYNEKISGRNFEKVKNFIKENNNIDVYFENPFNEKRECSWGRVLSLSEDEGTFNVGIPIKNGKKERLVKDTIKFSSLNYAKKGTFVPEWKAKLKEGQILFFIKNNKKFPITIVKK